MKRLLSTSILLIVAIFTINAQTVVKVAAAANLRSVFGEIKERYEAANPGVTIDVSFGSSGNFVSQILNGAKFDFFMAADTDFPNKLKAQG